MHSLTSIKRLCKLFFVLPQDVLQPRRGIKKGASCPLGKTKLSHLSCPPFFDGLLGYFDEYPNPPSRAGPANQFKSTIVLSLYYN